MAQELTPEEARKLDGLTETWNRLSASIAELEKQPAVARYIALSQVRAEVVRDFEAFAAKTVLDRKLKPDEARLDPAARKVVPVVVSPPKEAKK
jgi:hypothetical protein